MISQGLEIFLLQVYRLIKVEKIVAGTKGVVSKNERARLALWFECFRLSLQAVEGCGIVLAKYIVYNKGYSGGLTKARW